MRCRILLLIFICIFVGPIYTISVEKENFSFPLQFEKKGIPEIEFEDAAGNTLKTLSFRIPNTPNDIITEECYIYYHLFSGYGIDLLFVPGESSKDTYEAADTMLSERDNGGLGLNYNVAIGSKSLVFGENERQVDLPIERRNIEIVENATGEVKADNADRPKLTLTINPPSDGYMEGVYTGYIIMRLFSVQ